MNSHKDNRGQGKVIIGFFPFDFLKYLFRIFLPIELNQKIKVGEVELAVRYF